MYILKYFFESYKKDYTILHNINQRAGYCFITFGIIYINIRYQPNNFEDAKKEYT